MEILTVILLAAIFVVECLGVWSILRLKNKINYPLDRDKSEIPAAGTATMPDRGVYPIKRKTEVEQWESEVARVASRPKFS